MAAWQTAATVSIVAKHEADREQRERPDVSPQIAERREERRRIEERRQDRDEHDVRLQRNVRDAGHEAEREPAEHEQDRVRDAQDRRESEEPGARGENRQQDERVMRGDVHDRDAKGLVTRQVAVALRDDHGIDILDDRRSELGEGPVWDERTGDVALGRHHRLRGAHPPPRRRCDANALHADGRRRGPSPSATGRGLARPPRGRAGAARRGRHGERARHLRRGRRTCARHRGARERREVRPASAAAGAERWPGTSRSSRERSTGSILERACRHASSTT